MHNLCVLSFVLPQAEQLSTSFYRKISSVAPLIAPPMIKDTLRIFDPQPCSHEACALLLCYNLCPYEKEHYQFLEPRVSGLLTLTFFGSTTLPLASTRWVQLTSSSLCSLLPINLINIMRKILGYAGNRTQALGREVGMLLLCYALSLGDFFFGAMTGPFV